MAINFRYSNGRPDHVIRPFEDRTKKVSKKKNAWISGVRYSDGYSMSVQVNNQSAYTTLGKNNVDIIEI